jgi:hypothetical protein
VIITRRDFKKFRNGTSLDTVQEISGSIKTQVELLDLAKKDGKRAKVIGYRNKPVESWGPAQYVRFVKDKHKKAFGATVVYINNDRGSTLAAVAGLMGRFKSKGYSKAELVAYIEWCFDESESTEMSFSHICTSRFLKEWEMLVGKSKNKKPVKTKASNAFKRKMLPV